MKMKLLFAVVLSSLVTSGVQAAAPKCPSPDVIKKFRFSPVVRTTKNPNTFSFTIKENFNTEDNWEFGMSVSANTYEEAEKIADRNLFIMELITETAEFSNNKWFCRYETYEPNIVVAGAEKLN